MHMYDYIHMYQIIPSLSLSLSLPCPFHLTPPLASKVGNNNGCVSPHTTEHSRCNTIPSINLDCRHSWSRTIILDSITMLFLRKFNSVPKISVV